MENSIIVPESAHKARLDKFLIPILSDLSRSQIQKMVKDKKIKVNGKVVLPHHFLKSGETVEIDHTATIKPIKKVVNDLKIPLKIISETEDYLVVDKPNGVVVHPALGVNELTLIEAVVTKYPEIAEVGTDKTRPGIVQRLDRDVSGVMVIARTNEMFEHLKKQFADRQIHKIYEALVVGHMDKPDGTINFPLARSRKHQGKMAAHSKASDKTKEAVTHYTVLKQYQQVALLEINLETGRTHQIRVHLAAINHPIIGDKLYHPKDLAFKNNPDRIFLHARELSFLNLENELVKFESDLPAELKLFLKHLA